MPLQQPLVLLMALQRERHSFWYNRTLNALRKYGYEYKVVPSIDGRELGLGGVNYLLKEQHTGVQFNIDRGNWGPQLHNKLGALGCWTSHLLAWKYATYARRPVISLESDTVPVRPWNATPALNREMLTKHDIVHVHEHPQTPVQCRKRVHEVRTGYQYVYSTGAMLFTNRDPDRTWAILRNKNIDQPIGHWLKWDWLTRRRLSSAGVCPGAFLQIQDHNSSIAGPLGSG